MFKISKKVMERFVKNVPKFKVTLKNAKDRDVNESDTVVIINDMLEKVFGYDKYLEITSELAIRGTYCDLAIKMEEKFYYIIECKAIGIELKDSHIKQAIDYGANKGIPWVILTNGINWQVYKIKFEQPIDKDLVLQFDFFNLNLKEEKDLDLLYLLSKEGLKENVREEYFKKVQKIDKFIIGNLLLNEKVINVLRKELRKYANDVKIESKEIQEILESDVIKREIIDGEEARIAQDKLKKYFKKLERQNMKKECEKTIINCETEIPQEPLNDADVNKENL